MTEDLPFFQIVLVDIKKGAEPFNGRVECVRKNLYDPNLKYVAISYRWGEVSEQVVDTTPNDDDDDDHDDNNCNGNGNDNDNDNDNYLAHITSFSLTDFYELCQYIAEEVDLQHMDYVWIDAISVDQLNKERRKATIRHMSEIYEKATYVLAVPDLHMAHLRLTSANHTHMELVRKHAVYIYHIIANHDEGCNDIERIWCYNLLCDRRLTPSQYLIFYRHQLKSKLASLTQKSSSSTTTTTSLGGPLANAYYNTDLPWFHLMHPILTSSSSLTPYVQRHVEKYWFLNQTLNKSSVTEIQQIEKKRIQTPHRLFRLDTSSDHPDHAHRPRQLDLAWLNHPWRSNLTTVILPQWNQEYFNTTKELRQAFEFLCSLMEEWSNRTWVISEYLIAKQKQATQHVPMKFIFLLLRPSFSSSSRGGRRKSTFFHIFDHDPLHSSRRQQQQQHHPWRSMGLQFWERLASRLAHRDFIDMMVNSNATRSEDHFHSILPLWHKYKHAIKDNDTITSWGIVDKISVVMKLYELMDLPDKLRLLHASAQFAANGGRGRHDLVLPTFANLLKPSYLTIFEVEKHNSEASLQNNNNNNNNMSSSSLLPLLEQLNVTVIDLLPNTTTTTTTTTTTRPRLRLCANQYYKRVETEQDTFFKPYYQSFGKKLQKEPLRFPEGQLVAIVVPLFNDGQGSRLHLIGDEKTNRWILVRYIQFYHWRDLFTGPHQDGASFVLY